MNTKEIGTAVESKILSFFVNCGYTISIPFGDNAKYDLILDKNNVLYRLQCKKGRVKGGCIVSNTTSHNPFTNKRCDYIGKADYFAIYVYELDKIYMYPITDDCPKGEIKMRLTKPKNNQTLNIKFADNYDVKNFLES